MLDEAATEVSRAIGYEVSRHTLKRAFAAAGLGYPSQYLNRTGHMRQIPPVAERDTERAIHAAEAHELPDDAWTTAPQSQPPVVIVHDEGDASETAIKTLVDATKRGPI